MRKKTVHVLGVTLAILMLLTVTPVEAALKTDWKIITCKETVDIYSPVVSLAGIDFKISDITATALFVGKKQMVADFEISDNSIKLVLQKELDTDTQYVLKIFLEDGRRYQIKFTSSGLPKIVEDSRRQIIKVPAMPQKGFNWPYYLVIPSNQYKQDNQGHKRFLMVEGNNSGGSNDFNDTINKTKEYVNNLYPHSLEIAEKLWEPALVPIFPRPNISYNYDNETNMFYTHALDRDTVMLHINMKNQNLADILTNAFKGAGYDVGLFNRLDVQLEAMIDHAIEYLNKNGQGVELKKVFMSGYSASGTFDDRFTILHPDRIKAMASGATLDDMVLPLAEYKGEKLIFPIGTYDYKDITGKEFDLKAHNQAAKLIYMGEDDDNNVVPFNDCYGDKERNIITKLWGLNILPRAKAAIDLYGKSGGKGAFIFDKGQKHNYSQDMREYMLDFFRANRDSDLPVYPQSKNPVQLKATIYK